MDTSHQTLCNLVICTIVVLVNGWIGRWLDVVLGSPANKGLWIILGNVVPTGSHHNVSVRRGRLDGQVPCNCLHSDRRHAARSGNQCNRVR